MSRNCISHLKELEFSIGFTFGEFGGRYNNITPAFKYSSLICEVWWKDALSVARKDFGSGHLSQ